jgi:ABC-type nitrate/sulfonate/bicarbonate transport system ATPase subunit
MTPPVALNEVTHIYRAGGQRVTSVERVSFSADQGEFIALIGPSGCGKSTLLRLMAALLKPTAGSLRIAGAPPAPGAAAYMPQDNALLPWRTVLDNVVLGAEIQGQRRAGLAEARELLPRFGLSGFEHAYPAQLSGGMQQRAAFLRTFLVHKPVVLLDEPMGALDALTRRALQGWLHDLWGYFGYTIVLVTHDIAEAVYFADRVIVLSPRPGRVYAQTAIRLARPRQHTDPAFVAQVAAIEDLLVRAAGPGAPAAP